MERKGKKAVRDLKIHLKLEMPSTTNQGSKALDGLDSSDEDDDMDLSSKKKSNGLNGSKSHQDVGADDDDDFGFDPAKYVPFDDKVEFAELMRKATKEALTQVMNYLQEHQPEVVDDLGHEKFQVKIDFIERQAFEHCKEVLSLNVQ